MHSKVAISPAASARAAMGVKRLTALLSLSSKCKLTKVVAVGSGDCARGKPILDLCSLVSNAVCVMVDNVLCP